MEFQELVAVIRRVRREVEGPIGGSAYYGGGGDFYGGGGAVGEGLGRSSGVRHALLLRYIINPSDGTDFFFFVGPYGFFFLFTVGDSGVLLMRRVALTGCTNLLCCW